MDKMEELQAAIKGYRREDVGKLLQQGVLKECPEQERGAVCSGIVALRDMKHVTEMVKSLGTIAPDMLALDFSNHHNREFVARILKGNSKKLDVSTEQNEEMFFELACRVGEESLAASMIKNKKAVAKYPLLASGSEEMFGLIAKIDKTVMDGNQRVELLLQAALSGDPINRLNQLYFWGYDIAEKNDSGRTVKTLMEERISANRYPKNKNGELKRRQDKTVLAHIEKISTTPPEKEKSPWWAKALPVAVAVLAVVVVFLIGGMILGKVLPGDKSDSQDNTAAVGDTDDGGAQNQADTEPAYSTDTSLEVADGDTVNIDYVGYVDDVAFDGGNTQGMGTDLTIGSGSYIDDFEEQLIGHKVGENVTVEVTFPENYGKEELNGKDARFEVTINGIYQ